MYTTVEAIQEEGGYVEVELIIRDDAGFILCTTPIGCCETPPLEVIEIIGTVLSGPQGERGEQGPKGDKGDTGNDTNIISVVAGEIISGGKAVVIETDGKVYVYDISNENHYGKICGIAKQAALSGEALDVYISGAAYEAGSGWQAGNLYYVSATGLLTTIPPSPGITKLVGVGIGVDKILLNGVLELITI